jgi:hypothetical protein
MAHMNAQTQKYRISDCETSKIVCKDLMLI